MDTESVDEDDVMAGLISIHRVPPPARVSVSRLEPSARGHVLCCYRGLDLIFIGHLICCNLSQLNPTSHICL